MTRWLNERIEGEDRLFEDWALWGPHQVVHASSAPSAQSPGGVEAGGNRGGGSETGQVIVTAVVAGVRLPLLLLLGGAE